jgi:hypothetical protein
MRSLIKHVFTAATIAGILGSAIPAFAQTSDAGVNPVLLTGDQNPLAIAAACGIISSPPTQEEFDERVRAALQLSPPTQPPPPGEFDVQITVTGNLVAFTDESAPDQFNGTLGIEAVAVRRNGTLVYCYEDQVTDAGLDPPGTGVNQVTVIWGPGPCPLADVTQLCAIYNTPERTVDFIQGHLAGTQDVNVCGCPPFQATFCDADVPAGQPGSCIPVGETEFRESEFTGSATIGTGTCETITTTVGGRIRKLTVCN